MYQGFIITGWVLTFALALLIIIPWLKGYRHLLSAWNMFLLGTINFITLGIVQNARGFTAGEYGSEIITFVAALILFYLCASAIYFWPYRPRKVKVSLIKWPFETKSSLLCVAVAFSVLSPLIPLIPGFQGAQALFILNGPMSIFALTLALMVIARQPSSLLAWVIAVFCFAAGLLTVLGGGTGRRELVALFLSLPVVGYWIYLRNRPKIPTLIGVLVLGFIGMIVVTAYSTMRHTDREADSNRQRAMARISKLPAAVAEQVTNFTFFGEQGAMIDGQNAVWCGLLTIALISDRGPLEQDTLAMAKFVVVNPIPRYYWPNKPEGLGKILPVVMGEPRVTWGPSIIGHCFYDGGWWVVILYGLGFGYGFRRFDLAMQHDPTNPWLVALLASVLGHVIGLSRGDSGTFLVNILGPLAIITLILQPLRYFSGVRPSVITGPLSNTTVRASPYPVNYR